MSRFATSETVRIDLGEGDWVVVRKELGYGDRQLIQERLMSNMTAEQMIELDRIAEQEKKASGEGVDNGPKAPTAAADVIKDLRLNHRDANVETLLCAIVEWGGPGFEIDGKKAEITAENIAALDGTAETILRHLKEVMVTSTKDFTQPPTPRINTAAQAAQASSGSTT